MKPGTSRKILIIFLLVFITLLIGISVFIASKIQQVQAPPSSSAECLGWVCTSCGCGCADYFQNGRTSCCTNGANPYGLAVCSGTGGGAGQTCQVTYSGNTISANSACQGVAVKQSTTSYSGGASKCPTTEGYHTIGSVGASGGSWTATPAPGTCTQIDLEGHGGVCDCQPPLVVQNSCEKLVLDNPSSTTTTNVTPGQQVTVNGWAQDADGFSTIQVSVNGSVVGNATITAINCSNSSEPRIDVCNAGFTTNVYRYTYTYTVPASTTSGSTITVSVKGTDKANNTGAACQGQGSFAVTTQASAYCGDAICNDSNEKCERTTSGGTTYKACTASDVTNNSAPSGTAVSSCVGVSQNQPVTSTSCKYCGE